MPEAGLKVNWDIKSPFDIVDNCQTSHYVPFIQAPNTSQGPLYKLIFSEDSIESQVRDKFLHFTRDKFEKDSIYFYIWNGKNVNNKNSYSMAVYNIEEEIIEISLNSDINEFDFVLEQLSLTMPFFRFINGESKNVNAEIVFKNTTINIEVLYLMIDQDPIISRYLTIFESTNLRYNDKRLTLLYHNVIPTSYNITIKLSQKIIDSSVAVIASVNGAADGREMEEISKVISAILFRYISLEPSYLELIQTQFGAVPEVESIKYDLPTTRIKALSNQFPEVFGGSDNNSKIGYSRSCQKIYQPIIIYDDEIDSWEKFGRQVAQFPPPIVTQTDNGVEYDYSKTMFNYVCPDDHGKWPSIMTNKSKTYSHDNSQPIYTMVPCCCKVDRYSKYLESGQGPFAQYYRTEKKGKKEKIFASYGVIKEGSLGILPNLIETHLEMALDVKEYSTHLTTQESREEINNDDSGDDEDDCDCGEPEDGVPKKSYYMHYSVGQGLDSFIKCVIYALNLTVTPEEVRFKLSNLNKELFAQENIMGNNEYLDTKLNYEYVDPLLTYRGLEELYGVNIFVIDSQTENLINPYHNMTHIRFSRENNPCILIWYHSEMKVSELIVHLTSLNLEGKKNKTRIFGPNMNRRMYEVNPSHLIIDPNCLIGTNQTFRINQNAFSVNDWTEVFGKQQELGWVVLSQKIDNQGKCRGFNLFNSSSGVYLTLFVIPTQPLNLTSSTFQVTQVDSQTAIDYVGTNPISKIEERGYFFSLFGVTEYIFIPTKETPFFCPISKQISPYSILNDELDSVEQKIGLHIQASKLEYTLKETIWWSFVSNYQEIKLNQGLLEQWWAKFIQVDDDVSITDFREIYKLNPSSRSEECIKFLNNFYPEIFHDDRIWIPRQLWYNLYDSFRLLVMDYDGSIVQPKISIRKKYLTENDFNQLNSRTFMSLDNMITWIGKVSDIGKSSILSQSIETVKSDEPVMFKFDRTLYLVQREYNLTSAVINSYQFKSSKVNRPKLQTTNLDDNIPYIVYILENCQLLISRTHKYDPKITNLYAEIIESGSEVYALLHI